MHVSWVSGVPYAYALLRHGRRVGNEEYVRAAEAVLDHIAANLDAGRDVLAAMDARPRLDVGLASRPRARPLAHARRRRAVHAPRRRALGGGRALESRRRARARSATTARCQPRTTLETGDACRGTARPACRGSRRWSRRATSRRPRRAGAYYAQFDTLVRRARGRRPRADLRGRLRRAHGVRRARATWRPRAAPPTGC